MSSRRRGALREGDDIDTAEAVGKLREALDVGHCVAMGVRLGYNGAPMLVAMGLFVFARASGSTVQGHMMFFCGSSGVVDMLAPDVRASPCSLGRDDEGGRQRGHDSPRDGVRELEIDDD